MYFLQVYVLDPDGKHDDYLNSAWNYVQTFLFLIYPILSTVVLNCFSCRQILGDWYIVQDLSTQCYTAEWSKHAILAVVGIILYPVGIQVYTFIILKRNRHKLWFSKKIADRYAMLYARYEAKYYFWELTEMQRKLLLCSAVTFIAPGTIMQVIGAIAISSVFACAHIKCQPFEADLDDNLQTGALLSAVCTMWGAALVVGRDKSEPPNPLVGPWMVLVNVIVLIMALYALFFDILPSVIEQWTDRYNEAQEMMAKVKERSEMVEKQAAGGELKKGGGGDAEEVEDKASKSGKKSVLSQPAEGKTNKAGKKAEGGKRKGVRFELEESESES